MLPYEPLKDEEKVALWLTVIGHTRKEIAELLGLSQRKANRLVEDAFGKFGALNEKEGISKAIALDIVPIEKVRSYYGISPPLPEAKSAADEASEYGTSAVTKSASEDSLQIEHPRLLHVPSSFNYYPPDTKAFDVELAQAWKQFGYLPRVAMGFEREIASNYQYDDDRILYMKELGVHTLPYELYEKRLLPVIEEGGEKARIGYHMLRFTQQSQNAFHEQVPRGRSFKDLASMRTIRKSLAQGTPARDEWLLNLGGQPLGRDDVIYQLITVIRFLNKYPNYELALVDDFIDELMEEGSWAVKGTRALFLEDWEQDEQDRRIKIHFDSTDVAEIRRHQNYFHTLWNDKTKVMSDKREIIDFILQEITRGLVLAATG